MHSEKGNNNSFIKREREFSRIENVLITQSYSTLCKPMDCILPGSSVHGILQERVLEWVAILFSRASSPARDWTPVSCIAGKFFTICATTEAQCIKNPPWKLFHTLDNTSYFFSPLNSHPCGYEVVSPRGFWSSILEWLTILSIFPLVYRWCPLYMY